MANTLASEARDLQVRVLPKAPKTPLTAAPIAGCSSVVELGLWKLQAGGSSPSTPTITAQAMPAATVIGACSSGPGSSPDKRGVMGSTPSAPTQ